MTRLLAVLLAASAVPSIPAMAGDLQAEAAPAAAVDEDREFGYFQAYMQAYQAGDYAGMAEALVRFKGQPLISKQAYDATRNATRSLEHAGELLPSDAFDQVQWLQGSADLGGAQLLVFAEQWCPHCRREVPGLPAFAAEHQLDLVLLTRLSHSSTEEKMMAWVAEAGLTGPVGKTSSLADSLGVRGVPAGSGSGHGR